MICNHCKVAHAQFVPGSEHRSCRTCCCRVKIFAMRLIFTLLVKQGCLKPDFNIFPLKIQTFCFQNLHNYYSLLEERKNLGNEHLMRDFLALNVAGAVANEEAETTANKESFRLSS